MKLSYLGLTFCLLFTSTVFAEMDYFISPGPDAHFKVGDTIPFIVEDMPDEDDRSVDAKLYTEDGRLVKIIQSWNSQTVDESGEEFQFQWLADVTEGGKYYVEVSVGNNRDDVTQSYPFTIEAEGDEQTDDANADDTAAIAPPTPGDGSDEQSQAIPTAYEEQNEQVPPHKTKLSLHNAHSKVAHISSHNDIDTVSDPEPSSATSKKTAAQESNNNEPVENLKKAADSLTSKLPIANQASSSHHGHEEPLMPSIKPSAQMKDLVAADKVAVEEEKAWLAQQQKGGSPKSATKAKGSSSSDGDEKTAAKKPNVAASKQQQKVTTKKPVQSQDQHGKDAVQKAKDAVSKLNIGQKVKDIQDKVKEKTKNATEKTEKSPKGAEPSEPSHQKLTLEQQEALDSKAAKEELEKIKSSQASHGKSATKQKREAYRKVLRNRAKFAKLSLQ